ncbi:MAG: aminotransferase class I/II-fold pyridoxal phosphate-dependent enzyme, partial [Acidimicrobiales bacterium]
MLALLRAQPRTGTARGLAAAVTKLAASGDLKAGERLPPIRVVAEALELSPSTVASAWAMLAGAGTVSTDGRRGTVVTGRGGAPARYRRALQHPIAYELDLSTGLADPALLPDLRPSLRRVDVDRVARRSYLDAPDLAGLVELLRAEWPFSPDRLVMVDGAMDGLDLVVRQLVQYSDRVAVEEPCFPPLLDLLEAAGARLLPVALDSEGPIVADVVRALRRGATTLFLQPRAQNPTGCSVSAGRAEELAAVLRGTDAAVVEDDSSGSVSSVPACSLGRWLPGRTVHIRSFSKSHGSELRLAALSGPAGLVDPIVDRRMLGQGWTSMLLQAVLLDLLTAAPARAQVERARAAYAHRREAVVAG